MKKEIWDFVKENYPDYHSSDTITYAKDLFKLLNDEVSGNAKTILEEEYNNQMLNPQIGYDYDKVHKYIYEKSIENFLRKQENV